MTSAELTWRANAEANLLQARQRHGARLGSKKSRNGCSICKSRRVKCDEIRPECSRCRESGRACKYDSTPPSAPAPRAAAPLVGVKLSRLIGLRDVDRRTFDYFISHTAPRLAGAWDKEFWCNNVLQLAQHEPFILDSLLAISVLYEHPQFLPSFNGEPDGSRSPNSPGRGFEGPGMLDEHHTHALQLYNRAIQRLNLRMTEGKATHAIALLSCVLFICIETIRDDVFAAMSLFTQGTNMLKNIDPRKSTGDERSMLTLIQHIFQRMSVQAVLYGHPSGPSLRHDITINAHKEFENLAEARSVLFSLAIYSHSFMRQADSFRQIILDAKAQSARGMSESSGDYLHGIEMFGFTQDPRSIFYSMPQDLDHEAHIEQHGAFNALRSFFDRLGVDSTTDRLWDPQELVQQRTELLDRLGQWNEDFQFLLEGSKSTEQVPEAVSYLRLYHLASYIWVSSRLEITESVFDNFTADFQDLVRYADVYVRAAAQQLPIFTFEIGAVLPLFLTAYKCRVPSIRRRALDLMLQCPRKESTFGTYSCAQAICRLITIEESGLGLPLPDLSGRTSLRAIDDGVSISEDRRVHSFDLLKNRKERRYEIRITRYRTRDGLFERVVEDFTI